MALQSSGSISLNDIHVEAGGTTGTAVSINDSDVRALVSATAGSEMSLTDWYGAGAVSVDIQDGSLEDFRLSGTSSCAITFHTDGTITTTGNLTSYSDSNWYSPTTTDIGDNYKVKVVASGTGGTFIGPALSTYHALTSDKTWSLSTSGSQASRSLTVSLAHNVDGLEDQATITMTVEVGGF